MKLTQELPSHDKEQDGKGLYYNLNPTRFYKVEHSPTLRLEHLKLQGRLLSQWCSISTSYKLFKIPVFITISDTNA